MPNETTKPPDDEIRNLWLRAVRMSRPWRGSLSRRLGFSVADDLEARGVTDAEEAGHDHIKLTKAEIQSGLNRVKWAEGLILQLPETHDGRNSWLGNYGVGTESDAIRKRWKERHRDL